MLTHNKGGKVMPGGECCLCGKCGYIEWHHTIFRSQSKCMKTIKVNLVQLCMDCHRGTHGVHNDKKSDLKLKKQLQGKLQSIFTEKYYSKLDIKSILECTDVNLDLITKTLSLYTQGYNTEQLIQRLLGGRNY